MVVTLSACTPVSNDGEIITVKSCDFNDWSSLMEIKGIVEFQDTLPAPYLSVANKCIVGREQILFWDYKAKLVYAYNMEGKYLFTVGGIGRAENEYVDISDVAFSPNQKEIQVLDKSGIKIYNSNDGQFLRKRLFHGMESSTIKGFLPCNENSYLLFTPDNEYSICKIDSNDHVTPLRKRKGYQMVSNRFTQTNGHHAILPDYGHFTIDYEKDNQIIPAYTIDFGEVSLPQGMIPEDYGSFIQIDDTKDYFKSVLDYYENNKYIYASIVGPNQTYYNFLFSKTDGRIYVGPHDDKTNLVVVGMDNTYLYGLVYPEYVKAESQYYNLFKSYIDSGVHNPLFVKIALSL